MSPVHDMLLGAGAMLALSLLLSLLFDRSTFDTFTGCMVAWLVLPAFWVTKMLVLSRVGVCSFSPRALERFARVRSESGGTAWMLTYGRRGVIWVRYRRKGELDENE